MLNFNERTVFNKIIPKEKFYQHLTLNTTIKNSFVQDIKKIVWANKLSERTTNIERGEAVSEIEIIEIYLKNGDINDGVLEVISKQIPHKIIFVLKYEDRAQMCVYLAKLHKTVWQPENMLVLKIEGMNFDKVWDSFVIQISGLRQENTADSAEKTVAKSIEREKIEKQIAALTKKMHNEKQFNRQVKLKKQIAELRKRICTM